MSQYKKHGVLGAISIQAKVLALLLAIMWIEEAIDFVLRGALTMGRVAGASGNFLARAFFWFYWRGAGSEMAAATSATARVIL